MAESDTQTVAFDLLVIGGGPAGLSAGVYGARSGLSVCILEQSTPGGQIAITDEVDNYPGLPNLSGGELGMKLADHAEALGCAIKYDVAESLLVRDDGMFAVTTGMSGTLNAPAVIYAAGATPRLAGFEGELEHKGRGVSYCATCDGMFYRGKDVYVVGGGTAACEEALFLARIARSVTMVVRRDVLRTTPKLRAQVEASEAITLRYNTRIVSVAGEPLLKSVTLEDTQTGATQVIEHAEPFGVFVFVGHDPAVDLVRDYVDVVPNGIVTDAFMATKTPGLFVAGDVRDTVLRQVITAASDGAIAATSALKYLESRA
ncbi:MAG: FAD-dependent oxidoreductase [Coriobacteriia bacterium]|nr:FAD-dependent oxidoreductase [Coriobacteriia bacterium]